MSFSHMPVMPDEVIEGLSINPAGIYVDGTLGGAGHAGKILARLTTGRLIGIDRDASAIDAAKEKLLPYISRYDIVRGNFADMRAILAERQISRVDGVLLDLGVSSHQLDTPERGFSYIRDARLDMRMDDRDPLTAFDVVNHYAEKQLVDLLFSYGEERFTKRIVRAILNTRVVAPINTTLELASIIEKAVPVKNRMDGHPAKRTFQAIRIEVNNELSRLEQSLRNIVGLLSPKGRCCVITFHSLEDRIVKHSFRRMENPCTCPRDLPVCVCGLKPLVRVVTRKPMIPGEAECAANPRAHSAKLRIIERTDVYE